LAPQLPINPFQSPFYLLLYTRTFFPTPLAKKNALPFFCQSLIRESFSRFLLRHNFYSFLINVPIIHIEGFETSLLTLLGVSLVLWRRKADNALSNPCFWPSPLTSQHLHFQFPITSVLKIFVRSRRDWKEKMPGRIPTLGSFFQFLFCRNFLFSSTPLVL
jgi:hypothetical protein